MTNKLIINDKKLKLNNKTKVRLSTDEMFLLKNYIKFDSAPYVNIRLNTGITRDTIIRILERGWLQLGDAIKLRDFLKALKKEGII